MQSHSWFINKCKDSLTVQIILDNNYCKKKSETGSFICTFIPGNRHNKPIAETRSIKMTPTKRGRKLLMEI